MAETDLGLQLRALRVGVSKLDSLNESGNSLFLLCICSELLLWVQDKAYEIRVVSRTVPLMTDHHENTADGPCTKGQILHVT